MGGDCDDCDLNTRVFGLVPPILKYERVFDGNNGGPQWPGGSIDKKNNLLILTSTHNFVSKHYFDFVPDPPSLLPDNAVIKKCTSCHESKGQVKGYYNEKQIIPSLFLSSKIYQFEDFKNYLEKDRFHENLKFKREELEIAYRELTEYDNQISKNGTYKIFGDRKDFNINSEEFTPENGPFGTITAISLADGEVGWQIPAGTYITKESKTIIGSQTFGAVSDGENNDGVTFYTGSFDKKIYAIDNKKGKYLWEANLPASGTALPLVYVNDSERWIFVIATGGRMPNDYSDSIVAFRQKLN